uniref:Gustatory receptor n=1 Tax=Anopheles farauti TaxID=69004 RepID=A0A182QZT4_9DIPT
MTFAECRIVLSFGAFSCLLVLFQLFGFFNFPLLLHSKLGVVIGEYRQSTSIWWILQLCLTVTSGILAKRNYNLLFYGLLLTDAMNNYFKYFIGLMTAFVTLADSWFGAETHHSVWARYRDLATRNGTFLGLVGRDEVARVLLRYVTTFLTIVLVCVMVEYKIYYGVAVGTQWYHFWIHNIYPYTVSHFRHMFHLLHIVLMAANVRELNRQLVRLEEGSCSETTYERIEQCRAIYGELWQMNEGINVLFGFSQALNVASSFAQIAFDLYWLYMMWIIQEANMDVQMFCLLPTPLIFAFLLHAAKTHRQAMETLTGTLLDMSCLQRNSRAMELRRHFLTQLLVHPLRLTARNIFDFDYTLIRKVCWLDNRRR